MVSAYEKISLKILVSTVESSPCEELLGITIDSELNQKLSALARIAKYLNSKNSSNSFFAA